MILHMYGDKHVHIFAVWDSHTADSMLSLCQNTTLDRQPIAQTYHAHKNHNHIMHVKKQSQHI